MVQKERQQFTQSGTPRTISWNEEAGIPVPVPRYAVPRALQSCQHFSHAPTSTPPSFPQT
eukprot:3577427-Rhodomonas_salina.2